MMLRNAVIICLMCSCLSGCGPTYPKERLKQSIIDLCKKEYKLDVEAATVGRTIAIYLPLENLIDFTFSITKSASEKINDVILSVSRVALSTDARYDFYCVIAHDIRLPEIQIVIIKSVDDVKRFLLNDISRDEYAKRMIVDIRLSPQAQKERAVKEVFEKMKLDSKWRDEVMNDFFRSEPAGISDMGYWNGHFYIKDLSKGEFLAEQIVSRIRLAFREHKELKDDVILKSSSGFYVSRPGIKYFKFEILADARLYNSIEGNRLSELALKTALEVAANVLHSYYFDEFDNVEIVNQSDKETLTVARGTLEKFRKNKVKFEDLRSPKNAL